MDLEPQALDRRRPPRCDHQCLATQAHVIGPVRDDLGIGIATQEGFDRTGGIRLVNVARRDIGGHAEPFG
jgi:hypothetical protein